MTKGPEDAKARTAETSNTISSLTKAAPWVARFWLGPLDRFLSQLTGGRVTVQLPDGSLRIFGNADPGKPHAVMILKNWRPFTRLIMGGDLGLAESYMDGDWDSPDLAALFRVCGADDSLNDPRALGTAVVHGINRIRHLASPNSKRGSKKNIAYHYDLGNAFYDRWLDPTMTYSSALFEHPEQDMVSAQSAKYHSLVSMLDVKPGMRILEIGCGWGGLAEVLARDYDCHVTGITLSEEQYEYAQKRMARLGLSDKVEIRLQDYREVEDTFDRIASIEMFEAVGEKHWPVYFDKVKSTLNPGGKAALQIITIADERFETYRKGADFIQRYIFPGGMLPSPSVLKAEVEGAGFKITNELTFGQSYATTLNIWQRQFQHEWGEIKALKLGFDDRFKRMWEYYLAYCEGGFAIGTIDVCQIQLTPDR